RYRRVVLMRVMTKRWKHPRSGISYLSREVPEDIRQIIGKREWKVSLRTRDFATARPRFASDLIRCEGIFFAAAGAISAEWRCDSGLRIRPAWAFQRAGFRATGAIRWRPGSGGGSP